MKIKYSSLLSLIFILFSLSSYSQNKCESLFSEQVLQKNSESNDVFKSITEIESDRPQLSKLESDSAFVALTDALNKNKSAELNSADQIHTFLQIQNPKVKNITQKLLALNQSLTSILKTTSTFISNEHQGIPFKFKNQTVNESLKATRNTLQPFLDILNPFGFMQNRTSKLFSQLEKNPNQIIKQDDLNFLKKMNVTKEFEQRKDFINKYPRWTVFRRWISRLSVATLILSNTLVLNYDYHLMNHSIKADNYISTVVSQQKNNQIDVFVDIETFSHTAILIDGNVYSYGVSDMSVTPIQSYLKTSNTNSNLKKILPHSLQAIRINLDPEGRAKLKRDLELSSYKNYKNITLINDCTTMAVKAIEKSTQLQIPQLIDSSPTQLGLYFSLLKTLQMKNSNGDAVVDTIMQVTVDQPDRAIYHMVKNSYVHIVESNLFILNSLLIQPEKIYFNMTTPNEKIQWWDPNVKTEFKNWQREEQSKVQSDPQIQLIKEKILSLKATSDSPMKLNSQKIAIKKYVDLYFSYELQNTKSIAMDYNSDLHTYLSATYRFSALQNEYNQIISEL